LIPGAVTAGVEDTAWPLRLLATRTSPPAAAINSVAAA